MKTTLKYDSVKEIVVNQMGATICEVHPLSPKYAHNAEVKVVEMVNAWTESKKANEHGKTYSFILSDADGRGFAVVLAKTQTELEAKVKKACASEWCCNVYKIHGLLLTAYDETECGVDVEDDGSEVTNQLYVRPATIY